MLGSQASLVTLWNRGSSLEGPIPRGEAFWGRAKDPHPARVQGADGRWELVFDGIDDFVSFPQETVPQWAAADIEIEFSPAQSCTGRVETLFAARYDNRVGLYEIILDKGEIVVKGCSSDEKASARTFEFRTGLSASPDAWHSLKVWHTGTEMKASLDGKTASQEVATPAVFMNTAIMGGSPRNETAFFTGKVRKLVIDHAAEP